MHPTPARVWLASALLIALTAIAVLTGSGSPGGPSADAPRGAVATATPASGAATVKTPVRALKARKKLGKVGLQRAALAEVDGWVKRRKGGKIKARGWVESVNVRSRSGEESTELVLNAGDKRLTLPKGTSAEPGDVVAISGTARGSTISTASVSIQGSVPPGGWAPAPDTTFDAGRTDNVLVLPIRLSGSAPGLNAFPTTADLSDAMFGATGSVKKYFLDSSHGKVTLTGDVQSPVTISADYGATCPFGRWMKLADAASRAASTPRDPDTYDRVIYLTQNIPGCEYAAESGSPSRWTVSFLYRAWTPNRARYIYDTSHELMHQFGLFHEGFADCSDAVTGSPAPFAATCKKDEANKSDYSDLMSGGEVPVTGTHRLAVGLLPTGNVQDAIPTTTAQQYTLRTVDGGAATGGNPQLLRIPLGSRTDNGDRRRYLYLETRAIDPASNTFDGLSSNDYKLNAGVAMRIGEGFTPGVTTGRSNYFNTVFTAPGRRSPRGRPWDARPYFNAPGTKADGEHRDVDAWLRTGQSYYDPANEFTVTVNSRQGDLTTLTVVKDVVPLDTTTQTTVAVVNGRLGITAGNGAARNAISISAKGADGPIYVADYGNRPIASAGCSQVNTQVVRCERNLVRSIWVGGGDGDDVIAIQGDDLTVPTELVGGAGDDSIQGGAGDDLINGGTGSDAMTGGPGTDTVTYAGHPSGVTIWPNPIGTHQANGDETSPGIANSGATNEKDGIGHDIENAIGSSYADTFKASDAAGEGSDPYAVDGGGRSSVDRTFTGGGGADTFDLDGAGKRTVIALDDAADAVIKCGSGSSDTAVVDASPADPTPIGCETVANTTKPTITSAVVRRITSSAPLPVMTQTSTSFVLTYPATAGFQCKLESGATPGSAAFADCGNSFPTGTLAAGTYTFSARVAPAGSVAAGPPATASFVVDGAAPTAATFTGGPLNGTTSATRSPQFSFGGPAGSTFECRLGATGTWQPCPSTYTVPAQTGSSLQISVRAVSAAGVVQTATVATRTVNFAGTAPETTSVVGPTGLIETEYPSYTLAGTAGTTFECQLDFRDYQPCSSPYVPALRDGDDWPAGLHAIRVRAKDGNGNVDPTPEVRTFDLQSKVKLFSSIQWEGGTRWIRTNTGTLPFAVETTRTPGSYSIWCRIGSSAWSSCSPPSYPYDVSGQSTNYFHFEVEVRTTGATPTVIAQKRWWSVLRKDTTAPTSPVTVGTLTNGAKVTPAGVMADLSSPDLSASPYCENNDDGNSCVGLQAELDNSNDWKYASPTYQSGPLSIGSHTIRFRTSDLAGNVSPTVTRTFTVAAAPSGVTPTITLDKPQGSWVSTLTPGYDVGVNNQGFLFRYRCMARYPNWEPCAPGRFTAATGPVPAAYDAGVQIYDGAGQLVNDPSATYIQAAYLADVSIPTLNLTGGPAEGSTITDLAQTVFTFNTPDGTSGVPNCNLNYDNVSCVVLECSVNDGPFNACTSPTPAMSAADNGPVKVQIRTRDLADNKDTITRSFTLNAGSPPNTSIVGGRPSAPIKTALNLTFGSSPAAASYQCQLDGATTWSTCSTPYTGPAVSQGIHTLKVRAKGSNGAVDATPETVRWAFDNVAPVSSAPTGLPAGSVQRTGGTVQFGLSATDPSSTLACNPADPTVSSCLTLKCQFDAGTVQTCTSPFTSPTLTTGSHTFKVYAVDTAGNQGATQTLTFSAAVPVISFTSPTPAENGAGSRSPQIGFTSNVTGLRYQCYAQGYTGDTPTGPAFWGTDCTSVWTVPGTLQGTTALIGVRAIDAQGNETAPWSTRTIGSFTN